MGATRRAVRFAVGLVVLILAACSAGATTAPSADPSDAVVASSSPSPSPAASATPSSAPTSMPSPIAYGPVVVVEGSADCTFGEQQSTTDAEGVQHVSAPVTCQATFNDPRVGGTYTGTWNANAWGSPPGSMALVQWEDARITNAGGAWEGRATGVYSTDRGDMLAGWFVGTGGYAGLSFYQLTTGNGPWIIRGQIFPGKPPTL